MTVAGVGAVDTVVAIGATAQSFAADTKRAVGAAHALFASNAAGVGNVRARLVLQLAQPRFEFLAIHGRLHTPGWVVTARYVAELAQVQSNGSCALNLPVHSRVGEDALTGRQGAI